MANEMKARAVCTFAALACAVALAAALPVSASAAGAPRELCVAPARESVAVSSDASVAVVAAPRTVRAARRQLPCSITATWAAPASAKVTAQLEYSFLDFGRWHTLKSVPLATSLATGEGRSRGRTAFPLAGKWRMRQALTWDGVTRRSAWTTVTVASYRPKGKVRVLLFGDSMVGMPGTALKRSMKGTAATVVVDYRSSSGVSRPDSFNWPKRFSVMKRRGRPDVVVMMFGANDWQHIRSKGNLYERGTKAWDALYMQRVGRLMDIARSGDTVVYVVGQPIPGRSKGYARHMNHINGLARRAALKREDVRYISTWKLFENRASKYSSSLRTSSGRVVKMRARDKIHFTGAGGSRMAAKIRREIQADWRPFKP